MEQTQTLRQKLDWWNMLPEFNHKSDSKTSLYAKYKEQLNLTSLDNDVIVAIYEAEHPQDIKVLPIHKSIDENGEILPKNNFIDYSTPTVKKDSITFYGAGIFRETGLCLNKQQAMLAYIDLYKFIMKDVESTQSKLYSEDEVLNLIADVLDYAKANDKHSLGYIKEHFLDAKLKSQTK